MNSIHIQIMSITFPTLIPFYVVMKIWKENYIYFDFVLLRTFGRLKIINLRVLPFAILTFEKCFGSKSHFICTHFTMSSTKTGNFRFCVEKATNENVMNWKFGQIWITNENHGRKGSKWHLENLQMMLIF